LPEDNSETTLDSTPSIYVDRLIDEDIIKEIEREEEYEESRLGPGSIGITYRYYNNDTDSSTTLTEHGTQLRWRQETISNGSFELLAEGLISDEREDEKIKDGRVLFRQQEYVLKDSLRIDSEVGHFRGFTPTQISRSYRFYLPSTILQGVNTRFYNNDTSLSFSAGEIGALKPGDMFVQNKDGGIGHVSLVVDCAKNINGEQIYLIGYGFIPAQEFHIEKAQTGYGIDGWFTKKGYEKYLSEYPFSPYGKPVIRSFE